MSAITPDNNLEVHRVVDGKLTDTAVKVALDGQPASLRGLAR